jgi:S1-C subfamily serine protease
VRRLLDGRVVLGALGALLVVGALALIGVFDGGDEPGELGELAGVPFAGAQGEGGERIQALYERYSPGVVFIQARVAGEQRSAFGVPPRQGVSTGTGFLIDDRGHIVTNAHVVEGATQVGLRIADDRVLPAELVGLDLSTDLAVLRVDPGELDAQPLPLGDSAAVEVGDPVVAMGNPFGLDDTITSGIVSAKQRRITGPDGFTIEDVIQTDAAVNPGNSGGPLVNLDGQVIGVNSQIATGGAGARQSAGIAFAIPAATVREIVPDLIDDGEVSRPFLGVSALQVSPALATRLGLEEPVGAYVYGVVGGSPAAEADLSGDRGVQSGALLGGGDVILEVDGKPIRGPGDLAAAVAAGEPGETLSLTVVSGGEREEIEVELAPPPDGS